MSLIIDSPFTLAAYRQTQGMVIDRGGAMQLKLPQIGPCRSDLDWLCEPTKLVFVVTPFLGDITRFFRDGTRSLKSISVPWTQFLRQFK